MLIDDVTITFKAGNGGMGKVSFLSNPHNPRGGPDGGNGGNGGNIYIVGSHNESDLRYFRYKKHIEAENGIPGGKKKLFGKNAPHITIPVPIGTTLTNLKTNQKIEILHDGQEILLARGGKGGRGNTEFKSATHQTPKYAELGELGEEKEIHLQLTLIAQIGIIGLPNAGKSSLLKSITNADPKIANYPFTTLEPNLGVYEKHVIADIPGLIEGAASGKGLGIQFLKHIEKTTILLHCIEATAQDPQKNYETIRSEFAAYSETLLNKKEVIVITKIDLVDDETLKKQIKILKKNNKNILTVSSIDTKSIAKLKKSLNKYIQNE